MFVRLHTLTIDGKGIDKIISVKLVTRALDLISSVILQSQPTENVPYKIRYLLTLEDDFTAWRGKVSKKQIDDCWVTQQGNDLLL